MNQGPAAPKNDGAPLPLLTPSTTTTLCALSPQHGLDYLSVTLGKSSAVVDAAAQIVTVSVLVTNAAPRAGGYVVQVYFSQLLSKYTRYRSMLAGWEKVWLPAAGALQVDVAVKFDSLAYYDPLQGMMVLEGGDFEFTACASFTTCSEADATIATLPDTKPL